MLGRKCLTIFAGVGVSKPIFLFLFALVFYIPAFAQTTTNLTETPKPADSLVNSIGVNIHMTYGTTAYRDVTAVKQMLSTLHVRHVRDAGKYYPNDAKYNDYEFGAYGVVASLGIGFDLILDYNGGGVPSPMTPEAIGALQSLAAKNGVAVESYEGPNEPDLGGILNWVTGTRSFMQSAYSSAKANPSTSAIPVVGSSLAGPPIDWVLLGDMTAFEDYGNMHPYANTQQPTFNFATASANQIKVSGSQTIYVTEAGWSNATNAKDNSPNVSEDAAGRYMGRLFLETLLHGWPRTYAYELVDEQADPALTDTQRHFGLFRNDYSAKPAATVIANMIALMSDKGSAARPSAVSYSLATTSPALHHLLFYKQDGSYWLALWQEVSCWSDLNGRGALVTNPEVAVKLTLPNAGPSITTYRPHDSTAVVQSFTNQQTVALMVPDHPLLVRFSLIAAPTNLRARVQ
jgi:hypothetical protein